MDYHLAKIELKKYKGIRMLEDVNVIGIIISTAIALFAFYESKKFKQA